MHIYIAFLNERIQRNEYVTGIYIHLVYALSNLKDGPDSRRMLRISLSK